jgi:hypothetical protein
MRDTVAATVDEEGTVEWDHKAKEVISCEC